MKNALPPSVSAEPVGGGITVYVSSDHRFGTDAVLLSDFALPRGSRPPALACDLGSGCGIIPLLWHGRGCAPEKVYAVELQSEGERLMRLSVEKNGLTGSFFPICADLTALTSSDLPLGRFDLVTCNPPYTPDGAGIKSAGSSDVLARHEVGCDLPAVCRSASGLLRFGGRFCLCLRPERLADAICAMREHRLEPKRLRPICQREGCDPWLLLIEGRRGGGHGLKLEYPLIVERCGEYSNEMKSIYSQFYDLANSTDS